MMLNFFKRKKESSTSVRQTLHVDMHSHLLYGLDDGSDSLDESLELIRSLYNLGYKKLITTPHVMGDFYKNTKDDINLKLDKVNSALMNTNIDVQLAAAAEYYLDEWFSEKVAQGEQLLTLSDNYVLFETSYINRPAILDQVIFDLKSNGYIPVLAHPERYVYLYKSFERFEALYDKGLLFQININSLSGYYSKPAKKFAEMLIDKGMVEMAGTDCHSNKHLRALKKSRETRYYQKLLELPLLNNQL